MTRRSLPRRRVALWIAGACLLGLCAVTAGCRWVPVRRVDPLLDPRSLGPVRHPVSAQAPDAFETEAVAGPLSLPQLPGGPPSSEPVAVARAEPAPARTPLLDAAAARARDLQDASFGTPPSAFPVLDAVPGPSPSGAVGDHAAVGVALMDPGTAPPGADPEATPDPRPTALVAPQVEAAPPVDAEAGPLLPPLDSDIQRAGLAAEDVPAAPATDPANLAMSAPATDPEGAAEGHPEAPLDCPECELPEGEARIHSPDPEDGGGQLAPIAPSCQADSAGPIVEVTEPIEDVADRLGDAPAEVTESGVALETLMALLAEPRAAEPDADEPRPLGIVALRFCRKVHGFGHIEPDPAPAFRHGQVVLLYCEMEGVEYEPHGDEFRSRLETSLEILPADGDRPVWGRTLGAAEDACRRPRRDYYVSYQFSLPARDQVPAGSYRLRLHQTDTLTGQTATDVVPLTIAGP